MKRIAVLFANVLCVTAMAQRDFQLAEDRNAWLASDNAAALTTMEDSTIAAGKLFYRHDEGEWKSFSMGRRQNAYGADVRSYCRLSERAVVYGGMAYSNVYGTQMTGSMLFPTAELMPFDIVEVSEGNAGSKRRETFNMAGAIGWDAGKDVCVGARMNFTAGNYAKHRDLRHSNTLMNLRAAVSLLYKPWGAGGGFIYRRSTESLTFKTYGTADKVYQTLIDYANRCGETETFGGDGFTDDSQEQPLFSEYTGGTLQWKWKGLFMDVAWMHRDGYYGKQSQYTVSHSRHCGDSFSARLRYDVSASGKRLWWIDMTMDTEKLMSRRMNCRQVVSEDNPSLRYYEYYEPTKMSDKVQTSAAMAVTGYWKPSGEIYLWHVNGGVNLRNRKQTAYMFPERKTERNHAVAPFVTMRRGMLFRDTSLLTVQGGYAMKFGSQEQLAAQARIAYEMPLHGTGIRPCLSLDYSYIAGTGSDIKGLSRHVLAVSAEVTF